MYTYLTQFAADYDCNTYGAGTYDNSTCSSTDNGGLVPTGESVLPGLIGGALLIIIALGVLIAVIRKKKRQA